jgi:hypothetical protein
MAMERGRCVVTSNESRLSADADEVEEGGKSYWRINLAGLEHRAGDGYSDCKQSLPEVNRME